MFKEFFLFELKHWVKNPLPYIFLLVNFGLVLAAAVIDGVMIGSGMGNVNINSPFAMMSYAAVMSLISVVMTTTFVNQAALKDFINNFNSILFATPMKRASYLLGRFASTVLVACLPLLGVLLAMFVAPYFYQDASQVGPNYLMAYVDTFFTFLLPNTILISAIIFALAIKFRSTTISFIGAIFLLIGYLLGTAYVSNMDYGTVALLADPFGVNSIAEITKYWTLSEKNTQWISFGGPILVNRLLWLGVALVIFMWSYFNFSFSEKKAKRKAKKQTTSPDLNTQFKVLPKLSAVTQNYNLKSQFIQLFSQFKSDFFGIIKSPAFIVIVIFSVINLFGGIMGSDTRYASGNLPVTYIILEGINGSFHLFIYVIIAYYTGSMVWRERSAKFSEIIDASPFPSWIPLASKYLSMLAVVILMLVFAMFFGMGVQALKGYFIFEPMLYFKQLFLIDLSKFAIIIAISLFIHVCVNNMYAGFFVFILFVIANNFLWGALEINSNLLIVGETPFAIYSDMYEFTLAGTGIKWYKSYWLLFSTLLMLVSTLFWVRGRGLNFKNRWTIAKQRFSKQMAIPFYSVLTVWMVVGSFLFYNANILNDSVTKAEVTRTDLKYEQLYKQYENIDQPRIVALDYEIDIYPHTRKMQSKTEIVIKNKHDHAIDSIHFSTAENFETKIDLADSEIIFADDERRYYIYQLKNAMLPGDSLKFYVHTNYQSKGIENELSVERINSNGTFIHNGAFMPTIGYDADRENHESSKRKEFGLAPADRAPELTHACSAACSNSCLSSDSDWIQLSSTISTSEDQLAIAPGTLKKEWKTDGRNYFRYEFEKPVVNFYSFLSARYEVKRAKWDGIDLEVYYHKGHEYNVDKMLNAMRASIEYFSTNFSRYPHQQARIIEFPRVAKFAQAFPGTMPYSESMGFIADLKDENQVDQVFQVVAHEIAHQWWGHQVLGANMQGATMLSESFAHYSALMVLEKNHGKDIAQKFLRYEMDTYLRSRGGESIAELPLMKVENQGYIHYAKGSIVMNAMKEYIGEDSLNLVMQRFVESTAFQEPPYTNTHIFIAELEKMVPDSLQYLVDDMFKDIILYNNKATACQYKKLDNGQYELTLNLEVEKYRADEKGKEEIVAINDYIKVGVFAKDADGNDKEIYSKFHKFDTKNNTVVLVVDELPYKAGIDPSHLLIDRIRDDNSIEFTENH